MWSAMPLRDPQLKDIEALEFAFEGVKVFANVNAGRQNLFDVNALVFYVKTQIN